MTGTGLPHSEILGSKRACRSPRLIAACRVLHRLPTPRHPSCALCSLTTKNPSASTAESLAPCARTRPGPRSGARAADRALDSFPQLCLCNCQRAIRPDPRPAVPACAAQRLPVGRYTPRSASLCRVARARCPPVRRGLDWPRLRAVVGVPGVEPGTSSLSGTRSNQLSYTPRWPGRAPGAWCGCRALFGLPLVRGGWCRRGWWSRGDSNP